LNIDLKQEELEDIMRRTRELASNININTIESDTESSQAKVNGLLSSIQQIGSYLPDTNSKYNKTSESVKREANQTQAVESNLNEFENNNNNFASNLNQVDRSKLCITQKLKI
jgi:uncharacterized protein YoxC